MQPLYELHPRIGDGPAIEFRKPAFIDAGFLADFSQRALAAIKQFIGSI